jgi:type I restriction enzyme S subunit
MNYKPYPKYKDSGVEWLGDVPDHWKIVPLKHLVCERRGSGIQIGPFGGMLTEIIYAPDGDFKVYGQENVLSADFEKGSRWISEIQFAQLANYTVSVGDLLFTRKGSIGGCCEFTTGSCPGIIDSDTIRVSLDSETIKTPFLKFAFKFAHYQEAQIQMMKRGAILSGLNTEVLSNLLTITPPLLEQSKIAAFLDRECGKLDTLQAKPERLIALLKEKRQALISHAVTRGLPSVASAKTGIDPTAKFKPSGIEWLGEVPVHWEVKKLGLVGTFKGGAGFPDDYQGETENEIPFLKVGDIVKSDSNGVMRLANHTITRETAKQLRAFIFPCVTVVFAKVGAALLLKRFRTLGQPSCIDNNMMGMTAGKRTLPGFLIYVLPLLDFELIVNPGAVPSINEGQISSQRIALPPLAEQRAIVAHLDERCGKIAQLKAKAERAIALLKERRSALISAAVTGKIDVREATIK